MNSLSTPYYTVFVSNIIHLSCIIHQGHEQTKELDRETALMKGFKGPVCRTARLAEMEYIYHNYVFLSI